MGQTPGLNLAARLFGYVLEKNIIHLMHGEIHLVGELQLLPLNLLFLLIVEISDRIRCVHGGHLYKTLLHVFVNKWLIEDTPLLALGN